MEWPSEWPSSEQPCQVTALHHIGNYGGLRGVSFLPQTVVCKLYPICTCGQLQQRLQGTIALGTWYYVLKQNTRSTGFDTYRARLKRLVQGEPIHIEFGTVVQFRVGTCALTQSAGRLIQSTKMQFRYSIIINIFPQQGRKKHQYAKLAVPTTLQRAVLTTLS